MKACNTWSYYPYTPFLTDVGRPYICRLAPGESSVEIEWISSEDREMEYTVWLGLRDGDLRPILSTEKCFCKLTELEKETEYRCKVVTKTGSSRDRLFRTGACPGIVVNYLHPEDPAYSFSGQYLCSPSLVRHPDGFLLASMDVYGSSTPQNLTLIFRSDDDGKNWRYVSELFPCFWGKMFIHKGSLYMIACSTEYGDLLIGRSDDGGKTFGQPTVLLRGSCNPRVAGVHKNPQPVVEYRNRLWNTMEWGCWHRGTHAPTVISAYVDSDLLDPSSWEIAPPLPYDPSWPGTAEGNSAGNIEGTLVVAPDGKLYNLMRYDMTKCKPNYGRILAYRVHDENPGAPLTYSGAIEFPANHSKFEIQYDQQTKCYWSVASRILDSGCAGNRNLLSLLYSRDLKHWELAVDLIDRRDEDPHFTGFQYVDFFIEGEDILYLCRSALNRPHNFHDSNYSLFCRLKNFRRLVEMQA